MRRVNLRAVTVYLLVAMSHKFKLFGRIIKFRIYEIF